MRDQQKQCLSRSLPAGWEKLCCQQTLRMDRQAPETDTLKEISFLQAKLTAPGRAHIHSPCPHQRDGRSEKSRRMQLPWGKEEET